MLLYDLADRWHMNQEHKNDLAKRAYHRLVARALAKSPGLVDEARALVRKQARERARAGFVDEWSALLSRTTSEIRREITRPTKEAARLRLDSPFYLIPTRIVSDEQRRKLREIASRLVFER
jgi:hypothetical protein